MTVEKNPEIKNPEAPFDFINLLEVPEDEMDQFVTDWKRRSAVMGQEAGFISADLEKSLLKDHKYQIINVAHWQSYNAWVDANNDDTYSKKLANDLGGTNHVKVTRGFFRPVASYTHLYN